jgi:hypothetical protein
MFFVFNCLNIKKDGKSLNNNAKGGSKNGKKPI